MKKLNKLKNKDKDSFFSHSKNYLIAELFNKGIVFLTIPIFTRLLLPEEYGVISIFTSIISIFTVLIGMNFHGSINRKYQEKDGEFEEYLGTNITFLLVTNIIFIGLGYIFKSYLSSFFAIDSNLFFIAILISSLGFYIQIELSYLQGSQQSSRYAKLSVIRNLFLTFGAIVWMYLLKDNRYLGKIYSQLIITAILSVFVIYNLLKMSNFNFKKEHIVYSLGFGVPLIPHALSGFILSQFDRIIINQISGSYETGLYSFAYNIGMIMTVFTGALNNAWVPILYKHLNNEAYEKIQTTSNKYAKVIFFIALGLILFSKEIIMIMADKRYFEALKIVPIIIMGMVMTFLYILFVNYAFYRKKTGLISLYTFIAGFTNIGLNYMFIPKYGYIAAAWTTLASYVLLFVLHYINSKYILKEKVIKLKEIMIDLGVLLMTVVGYLSLNIDNYWIDFLVKVSLIVGFVAVVGLKEVKELLKNRN